MLFLMMQDKRGGSALGVGRKAKIARRPPSWTAIAPNNDHKFASLVTNSAVRTEYPHSLSYHMVILPMVPAITLLLPESNILLWA